MRRGLHQRRMTGDDRGAAAVEFALVFPILLLLVFGIIVYGFVFNAKLDLQTQARNAARSAAAALPAASCSQITGVPVSDPLLGSATTMSVTGCSSPAVVICSTANAAVKVTLTSTFNNPIPLIPAPATLSGEGQFACEGA